MPRRLKRLLYVLSLCGLYAAQRIKTDLAYRGDFLFSITTSALYTGLQLFFLWALFSRTPSIAGWTFEQVVLMFGFSQVSFGYFSVLFFEFANRLPEYYIIEGNLDRPLLRPFSPLGQLLMENINLRDLQVVLKGTAIVWWALAHLDPPVPLSLGNFLMLNLLGLLGACVYAGVFLTISSLNFWIKDRVGLVNPLFSVTEAARYPITIYSESVRFVFTFVIPFAFCAFFPAAYFTDPQAWGRWLLLGPLIAACGMTLGITLFNRGLRVYESTGS